MTSTTKILASIAITIGLVASPALALCDLCNASVRLDEDLANCFIERADAETERLTESGAAFIMVDLSDCQSRGGLPTGAPAGDGPITELDQSFIADVASLACLSEAITTLDAPFGDSQTFDLSLCG